MGNHGSPYLLGRFLRSSHLKENQSRVHKSAFDVPSSDNLFAKQMQVSCFEVQGLEVNEVFAIADDGDPPILLNNKPPVAYACISEADFPIRHLQIDFDNKPSRHTNIIGWEKYADKSKRLELAATLAEIASNGIVLRP